MVKKYLKTLSAELETLATFRDFIEEVCRENGVEEETCFDIKLAVDEACTNIIQHGYAGMNPGSIILDVRVDNQKAQVHITDFGHPFEPNEAPTPDTSASLEERPLGGFGLFFIYQSMDEVDYVTNEEGNTLMLTKRFNDSQ